MKAAGQHGILKFSSIVLLSLTNCDRKVEHIAENKGWLSSDLEVIVVRYVNPVKPRTRKRKSKDTAVVGSERRPLEIPSSEDEDAAESSMIVEPR